MAALLGATFIAACGGGSGSSLTPAEKAGQAAVAARQIPQGVKITHTEPGATDQPVGAQMPKLKTYAAAKQECGYWHAWYYGRVYGPGLDGNLTPRYLNLVAYDFAQHRAAPGAVADVRHGCRAGLHK